MCCLAGRGRGRGAKGGGEGDQGGCRRKGALACLGESSDLPSQRWNGSLQRSDSPGADVPLQRRLETLPWVYSPRTDVVCALCSSRPCGCFSALKPAVCCVPQTMHSKADIGKFFEVPTADRARVNKGLDKALEGSLLIRLSPARSSSCCAESRIVLLRCTQRSSS